MRLLCALAFCLLLAGCSGGSGGSGEKPVPAPAPLPRNAPPLCFYFGVVARQIEETADHVHVVYSLDWGDWDTMDADIATRILADLLQAKALGYRGAIVGVGFTMFSTALAYKGTAGLVAFRQRVEAIGLPIIGISLIDEPDMRGVSDEVMTKAHADAKAAWPGVKLFCVYGDHGTPGSSAADVIGKDAYPDIPTLPIRAGQERWIFPGGADPWRTPPDGAMALAAGDPSIVAVCAFIWGDRPVGKDSGLGIRSNGLADAYRKAFAAVQA